MGKDEIHTNTDYNVFVVFDYLLRSMSCCFWDGIYCLAALDLDINRIPIFNRDTLWHFESLLSGRSYLR